MEGIYRVYAVYGRVWEVCVRHLTVMPGAHRIGYILGDSVHIGYM